MWCASETRVPFRQQLPQFAAQREQFFDAPIQPVEPLTHECPNAPAWRASSIPRRQDTPQIPERESHYERPLNQENAVDRGRRVSSISGKRSRDTRKQALSFVVPKGISADTRGPGDISRTHRPGVHRARTLVESPVPWSAI